MSGEPRTFRLAIGLFSEVQPLHDALAAISSEGITLDCLCLIGCTGALRAGSSSIAAGGRIASFRPLFEQVRAIDPAFDTVACEASSGPLLDELRLTSGRLDGGKPRFGWLSEGAHRRLGQHVRDGGLVLVVSSPTPTQQDSSCRTLLGHSRHSVQTCDFTIRRGD